MTENQTNNQTNNEKSLTTTDAFNAENKTGNEYMNDFRTQAQDYGQRFQDAAGKARNYATEKYAIANDKFKELQNKDPKELVEEAKEYARQKPGQALLVSAAVGLFLGFIFRGRK